MSSRASSNTGANAMAPQRSNMQPLLRRFFTGRLLAGGASLLCLCDLHASAAHLHLLHLLLRSLQLICVLRLHLLLLCLQPGLRCGSACLSCGGCSAGDLGMVLSILQPYVLHSKDLRGN